MQRPKFKCTQKKLQSLVNIPEASVTGMEVSSVLKPSFAIDVVSTLRYTLGKDNNNNPLPYIAPLKNITSLRYQPKKFSIQLEYEAPLKQKRVNSKAGEDITPGYLLLHSRFGYITVIFRNNVEMQAGVENILDKKYHEHLDWGIISRPGRNFYVQIKVSF